jgi:hypothetical protein
MENRGAVDAPDYRERRHSYPTLHAGSAQIAVDCILFARFRIVR